MIHEAETDRIVVNVIDHRPKPGRFLDVPITSARATYHLLLHFAEKLVGLKSGSTCRFV
jgi:hypothetical protein